MSAGDDFFDSNVILYGVDAGASPAKRDRSRELVERAVADRSAVISWQVVQETLHVVTHRFKATLDEGHRHALLTEVLLPLWRVQPNAALFGRSLEIQNRYKFGFYDCLIVGAALEAGCKRLLTEDLQHGQRIEGLRVENPFRD